MTSADYPK